MKHSLVESRHLAWGVGVIIRYEVLVSWGGGEGSFVIEEVDERVFGKSVVFLGCPQAGEWVRSGGGKEGNDARLERPREHGRLDSKVHHCIRSSSGLRDVTRQESTWHIIRRNHALSTLDANDGMAPGSLAKDTRPLCAGQGPTPELGESTAGRAVRYLVPRQR